MTLRAILSSLALALAAAAAAADDPTELRIESGATLNLCSAGLIVCPVSQFLCDDPKIAIIEHGPYGAELKARSPGTTTCMVRSSMTATRRVMRVTVR